MGVFTDLDVMRSLLANLALLFIITIVTPTVQSSLDDCRQGNVTSCLAGACVGSVEHASYDCAFPAPRVATDVIVARVVVDVDEEIARLEPVLKQPIETLQLSELD